MNICNFCKQQEREKKLLACGACGSVSYCSKQCQVSTLVDFYLFILNSYSQKNDWKSHKVICKRSRGGSVGPTESLSYSESLQVEFKNWSKTNGQALSLISLMCLQQTHPENACEMSIIFNPRAPIHRERIQIQSVGVIPLATNDAIRAQHQVTCTSQGDFVTIIIVKCINIPSGESPFFGTLPCIVNDMMVRLATNEVRKWEERQIVEREQHQQMNEKEEHFPCTKTSGTSTSSVTAGVSRGYIIPLVNVINFGQAHETDIGSN
jgi:hypothetical protein